jgi:uncharacterized membrane protein
MSTTRPSETEPVYYQPMVLPPRQRLAADAPRAWLREGWAYFKAAPASSITYGVVFALIGLGITLLGLSQPKFILTFWSGFLLVGPLLAMGLYRIAQLHDRGEKIRMTTCWGVLRKRLGSITLFSLLLALVMIAWIRFSTLIAAVYVGNITGTSSFITAMASPEGIGFLAVLTAVGGVFAVIMFALTAWSLPLLLDQRADFGPAVVTSVKATLEQPGPMILWGALVGGLTLFGMLTFFIGFVVIFPLLGYATWAAYKELFGVDKEA